MDFTPGCPRSSCAYGFRGVVASMANLSFDVIMCILRSANEGYMRKSAKMATTIPLITRKDLSQFDANARPRTDASKYYSGIITCTLYVQLQNRDAADISSSNLQNMNNCLVKSIL